MRENFPSVSIIIVCRNEEKFIGRCLDSIIANDYPKDKLEILVVDGRSEDRTREIIEDYSHRYPFIKLLDSPKKYTSFGLNIGIKETKSENVMTMGAHATYEKDYISKCLKYLKEYNADNVGGMLITVPGAKTFVAEAIALCLSHSFGAGGSYFRIGAKEPRWVDTVFGGCYKKEVFEKIGLFNEKLIRSQDLEFNLRLKKAGGKILLTPEIVSYYYPKSTNIREFFKRSLLDGIWAIYPLKFIKIPFKLRHYIPLIFVLSLMGTGLLGIFLPIFLWLFLFIIGLYFLTNAYFSSKVTLREKDFRYFFIIPVVFATRHIGYGLGSIWGLIKLF